MARFSDVPLAVLIPQVFLAIAWIRSAVAHSFESDWWNGEQIQTFAEESGELGLPFYAFLAELILAPLASVFAVVVVAAQALLGLLLLVNVRPRVTALASIFLSTNFIMGGHVNPSVFYIISALAVLSLGIDTRPPAKSWKTLSKQATVLLVLVVLLCAPFIRTMHPVDVIDDPAIVLITVVAIFAAVSWVVYLRLLWFPDGLLAIESADEVVVDRQTAGDVAAELESIALQVGELAGRLSGSMAFSSDNVEVDDLEVHDDVDDDVQSDEVAVDEVVLAVQSDDDGDSDDDVDSDDEVDSEGESDPEPEPELVEDVAIADGLVIVDRAVSDAESQGEQWFSVRCHFQLTPDTYEERITIWRSGEFEEALEMAEQEARKYASERGGRYLESCDGYRMSDPTLIAEPGQQIYSLTRTSSLAPAAYLRQFFFTGAEQSLYA